MKHSSLVMLGTLCLGAANFPMNQPTAAETAPDSSPLVTADVNPRLKSPITMNAQDANLSEVLKVLADHSGMNFVSGEGIDKAKITIILDKTPVDEAIDLVVRAAGLSYEILGNSVLIAEPDKLNRGEVGQQGYVVALKYANAREVAGMLEKITPNIKVDDGGNRLICFTSPRIINEIERIVKSIDHPSVLVMLETRLIEVQVNNNNKYGIDWARLTPVVSGLTHPDFNIGNNWTLLHPTTGAGASSATATTDATATSTTTTSTSGTGIDLALDFMVSTGDARLLMDSKLTTTNNRPASLHIGEVIPYEIQSYNFGPTGGGGANTQIQQVETGIKINMLPQVNENNEITITVEPEVSNVEAYVGVNKDLPQTQVRKTSTTVRVKDGQTVFIAGLLREDKTTTIAKVPVIGDIPLIGLLFQNKMLTRVKTNLVLEITPRIVRDSLSMVSSAASPDIKMRDAAAGKEARNLEPVIVPVTATLAEEPPVESGQQQTGAGSPALDTNTKLKH